MTARSESLRDKQGKAMIGLGSDKKHKMCCFANPLMRWDEYRYFYNTGKFIFAMMNEQTFNQTVTVGFSYQRRWLSVWRALRDTCCGKYNWGFGISFPYCHYDSYCVQNVFIICVFPIKKSKVALEAQKNNPCHDFHILYGLAELFGYRTWSSDLLGLMPRFPHALGQFSCFFSVTVLDIPKYPSSQNIPLFSSE